MSTFQLFVLVNPFEGRDAEFNDWYDSQHVHDALTLKGYRTAQRYRLDPVGDSFPMRYMVVYEVEADSPEAVKEITKAGRGTFFVSDATDVDSAKMFVASPLGPLVPTKSP